MDSLKTLLLVEDDPQMVGLVKEVLTVTIATLEKVLVATSIGEAREYLRDNGIDCVVLDLKLTDAHGLAGMRAILEEYPSMRVVILTGTADTRMAIAAERAGVRYLTKGMLSGGFLACLPMELRLVMQQPHQESVTEDAHAPEILGDVMDFWRWRGQVENQLTSLVGTHHDTCLNLQKARESMEGKFEGTREAILKLQLVVASCTGGMVVLGVLAKIFKLW